MYFVALIFNLGLQVLDVKGHGAMVSPLSRNAIGKEMRRYLSQIRYSWVSNKLVDSISIFRFFPTLLALFPPFPPFSSLLA